MQKTTFDRFIAVFAAFLMVFYLPIEVFPGIKASAANDVYIVTHGENGLCLDKGKLYPDNTPATRSTLDEQSDISDEKKTLLAYAMSDWCFNRLQDNFTSLDQQSLIWGIMSDDSSYAEAIAYMKANFSGMADPSRVYILVPQDSSYQRLITTTAPTKPDTFVDILFDKVGSDDPSGHLGGAQFVISPMYGSNPTSFTSSSSGAFEKSLKTDTKYELYEVEAPQGYAKLHDTLYFTVDEDGNITCDSVPDGFSVSQGKITCTNQKLTGATVTIRKVDEDNKSLTGADFTISHGSKYVSVSTVDDSTKTAELYEGESYTITESTVPDGYTGAGSMSFTVSDGSIVPTDSNANYSVSGMVITCQNKATPMAKVTINKVDSSRNSLSGATLVIDERGYSSSYSKTITSSSEEVDLVVGNTYVLSEESAPSGYRKLSESFTFTVNESGITPYSTVPAGYSISGMTITVINDPIVNAKVAFRKVDESDSELSGAKFTLSSSSSYSKTVTSSSEEWELEVGETYTLTEDEAPSGYNKLSGSFKFTVTSETSISVVSEVTGYSVSGMTITVKNVPVETRSINIRKVDSNGNELPGATLVISGDSGFSTTITSANESVTLPVGTYYLEETSAPTGYVKLASPIKFTVTEYGIIDTSSSSATAQSFTLTVINNMAASVTVKKVDDGNHAITGAKFSISGGGKNESFTVDSENGYSVDLESGVEYTLSEDEAPNGYEKASGSFRFKVVNGDIQVTSENRNYMTDGSAIKVANTRLSAETIQFNKIDNHGDPVTGAKFSLEYPNGKTEYITLPTNLDLYEGSYTLKETEAPEGYEKRNDSFKFSVSSRMGYGIYGITTTDGYEVGDHTITVTNKKYDMRSVTFKKVDESGNSINGAAFSLRNTDDNITQEFTIDSGSITMDLIVGKNYRIYETSIPDGYDSIDSLWFKVNENDITRMTWTDGYSTYGHTITITNKKLTYDTRIKARFMKVDESGNPVSGAVFSLTDGETNETLYFDSSEIDRILVVGNTYTLSETTIPEGYEDAGSFTFKVTADGLEAVDTNANYSINSHLITITDKTSTEEPPPPPEPSNIDVTFNKVDENGNALSGATFRLTGPTTEVLSFTGSPITLTLVTGEQYTLSEYDTPEGYSSVDDFRFTVSEDGAITYSSLPEGYSVSDTSVSITITNKREPQKEISFRKVDENDVDLSGAVFTLSTDGQRDITINCTGSVVAKNLAVGRTYTLTETTSPAGYRTVKPFVFTVSETGIDYTSLPAGYGVSDSVITITNEPVPDNSTPVIFSKIDENNKKLSGAVFTLTHGSDSDTIIFTGSDITEHLEIGETYTVEETTVPTGYTGSTGRFTFTVTADGIEYVSVPEGYTVTTNKITIKNTKTSEPEPPTPSNPTVKILKIDATNNVPLASAKLQIVEGTVNVKTWTSTTEAYTIKTLEIGKTYTLKEIVTPEGYTGVTSDFTFTVTADGLTYESIPDDFTVDGFTITVKNTEDSIPEPPPEPGKPVVKILKIDAANNIPLAGAKLQIVEGESSVKDWTSTASACTVTNLEYDKTYTLKEIKAPTGYTGVTSDFTFKVTAEGLTYDSIPEDYTVDGFTITVKNSKEPEPEPGKPIVRILKVDAEGQKHLAGATLQILENGSVIKEWTSTTDEYVFDDFEVGKTYVLREKSAPEGYTGVTDEFTFTITSDSILFDSTPDGYVLLADGAVYKSGVEDPTVAGFTIIVENSKEPEPEPGKPVVKILKIDAADSKPLAGAKLQIVEGESSVKDWTSTARACTVTNLEYDKTYTLKEIKAPTGYTGVTSDFTFTVTADGLTYESIPDDFTVDGFTITVKNTEDSIPEPPPEPGKPVVKILKIDAADSKPLAGAKLQIIENESVVKEWISTTKAYTITDLKVNTGYVLHEESAPEGYKKADDIMFTIDEDGKIYVSGKAVVGNTIVMSDEAKTVVPPPPVTPKPPITTYPQVSIIKVDADTNKPLANAHFQILDGNTVVKDWVSTTEKYDISDLEINKKYTIHEVSAPEGYLLAADTTFTIYNDNIVATTAYTDIDGTLVIKDKKAVVRVSKVESSSKKELAGAQLAVYCNGQMIDSWTSDGFTEHVVTGLKANTTYSIRELSAPTGYSRMTADITFSIDNNGAITANAPISNTGAILVENSSVPVTPSPTPCHYYPTPEPVVLRYIIPDYLDYYTEDVAAGAGMEDDGEEIVD